MKVIYHSPKQEVDHDQESSASQQRDHKHHHSGRVQAGISNYAPLFALITVSALMGIVLNHVHEESMIAFMHYFMGTFLCLFALVKLFDLKGFSEGFAKYDLLGQRSHLYALTYPFLELSLGLSYLGFFMPTITYVVTVGLLGFGAIGVLNALKKGKNLTCACMGSVLKVPLSHVTLGEDLGMAAMALYMLLI